MVDNIYTLVEGFEEFSKKMLKNNAFCLEQYI